MIKCLSKNGKLLKFGSQGGKVGTAINPAGTLTTTYFNGTLSVTEAVNILNKLDYSPMMNVMYYAFVEELEENPAGISIFKYGDEDYLISDRMSLTAGFGWCVVSNPELWNSPHITTTGIYTYDARIEVEPHILTTVNSYSFGRTVQGVAEMEGFVIGAENNKLTGIFSADAEFTEGGGKILVR